ncbi:hypothetical protein ABIC64_002623 [Plantibacter flavus]
MQRLDGADTVVFTGGGKRGGFARNLAVRHSTGTWIAFLDDDDTWLPGKIEAQLRNATSDEAGARTVYSTRVVQSVRGSGVVSRPVPEVTIVPGQRVEDYLFRRRRPSLGRAGIFTSTLFMSRVLASSVPWDESLSRHQDWDWLARLQRDGDAQFRQLDIAGSTIWMGSAGSISASADWRQSLSWARSQRDDWAPGTYVDFVAGQSLRYSTQARSWKGAWSCAREIARARRVPSLGPAMLGIGGLVPRDLVLGVILRRPGRNAATTAS